MTIAHLGSNLPLVNMVPTLPEGMILFPLNGNVNDTSKTISIISNQFTPRYDEKKFSSSVAVETITNNLIATVANSAQDWSQWTHYNNPSYWDLSVRAQYDDPIMGKVFFGTKGAEISTYLFKYYPFSYALNEIFTNSIYLKASKPFTGHIGSYLNSISGGQQHNVADHIMVETKITTEWKRYTATHTIKESTSGNGGLGWQINLPEDVILYAAMPQLESKKYVTSFVNGSRLSHDKVVYDITGLGMKDAGCVSCWIYTSESMINNHATDGVNPNNQYLLKLWTGEEPYYNATTLWIPNKLPRYYSFWSSEALSNLDYLYSNKTVDLYGNVGKWNHFVIQWDNKGLPTGNKKELYINGELQNGNNTSALPNKPLTHLEIGGWDSIGSLKPSTIFEQLAIHPSKGFSPEVIYNWYRAQSPFYDVRDKN